MAGQPGFLDLNERVRALSAAGAPLRHHRPAPPPLATSKLGSLRCPSDEGDAGVQGIGSAVVDVTAGDYFEPIARQTSASTKSAAANELTWFALKVVE